MRRLAAHLALAAIYASFFAPLISAAQTSPHACCRRNGLHHCQPTNEAGFHSKTTPCPYSTSLPPGAIFCLESAKFRISAPAFTGILVQISSSSHSVLGYRSLPARGPPSLL